MVIAAESFAILTVEPGGDEITDVLGAEEGEWFARVFDVTPKGNYVEEATGKPKPRKSRDVNVVIEPLSMNGKKVNVATIALGKR